MGLSCVFLGRLVHLVTRLAALWPGAGTSVSSPVGGHLVVTGESVVLGYKWALISEWLQKQRKEDLYILFRHVGYV